MKHFLVVLTLLLVATVSWAGNATVNATLVDGTGNPVSIGYVQFELTNCGYNIPVVPSSGTTIVQKLIKLAPSDLPANLIGNDQIPCGNKYSTLWHVTAFSESDHPIAGDMDYDICIGTTNCASGIVTASWNLGNAQPWTGAVPTPGFITIFGNPIQGQQILQPGDGKQSSDNNPETKPLSFIR